MATTTKKARDIMDSNVLLVMQNAEGHAMRYVKWIRYAANKIETGESYRDGPYSEAQIRGSLKRLEAKGLVESRGWAPKTTWHYVTDEMIQRRAIVAEERRKGEALAEAIQEAIGLGVGERDEDGDLVRNTHVTNNGGGYGLKLTPKAGKALAAALGIDFASL